MRNLIFAGLVVSILSVPVVAQENLNSNTRSAASAGASAQVGASFGGTSLVSITLAATVITSLLAFVLEDSNDAAAGTASTD